VAFTDLPLVDQVIEQQNLLERKFHGKLEPDLAYAALAERDPIKARGGETLTVSRPSLYPLNAAAAVVNPETRSGLDNGLTPQTFGYEQVQYAVQEYALAADVSLEQEQVLVASLVIETVENLAQNAAAQLDQIVSQTAHAAAESGNSYITAAVASAGTSLHLDNIKGFDTAYSTVANSSPGLPAAVSASNTLVATVYNGATGAVRGQVTITAAAADGSNASTAAPIGVSGTLTVTATTFNISAGDQIVAVDGSYILRPNGKLSRFQLANTDLLTLEMLADARAKLRSRGVPPLPNGMYAAIVDPLIMPQLISDTAWQRATQGGLETMRYFKRGVVLPLYGLEVVESTMVPNFSLPAAGSAGGQGVARHALVAGRGALKRAPYEGLAAAVRQVESARRGVHIIRPMKWDLYLVLRQPIDRLGDVMSMLWKTQHAFNAMTDVTSTPAQIPTSDFARFKRMIEVEVYSAS
jgi:hypothetical protein